jgi:hypothetical protein
MFIIIMQPCVRAAAKNACSLHGPQGCANAHPRTIVSLGTSVQALRSPTTHSFFRLRFTAPKEGDFL